MQSLEGRVSQVEDSIKTINQDLKDLKREMSEQDEKIERKIDEKFKEIETKIDKNNDAQTTKSDKIADGVNTIKETIFTNTLTQQKLQSSIELLQADKESEKHERNKLKWAIYGVGFSLLSTLVWTWIRLTFGLM